MPKTPAGRMIPKLKNVQQLVNQAAATPGGELNFSFRIVSRRLRQLAAMLEYLETTNPGAVDGTLLDAAYLGDVDRVIEKLTHFANTIASGDDSSSSSQSDHSSASESSESMSTDDSSSKSESSGV